MKHYKKITSLIYGALLLICVGIVWFLGALNRQGNTGDGRESAAQEGSQQSGENPNGGRTPGTENGPDVAGNGLDESEESEEERLASPLPAVLRKPFLAFLLQAGQAFFL